MINPWDKQKNPYLYNAFETVNIEPSLTSWRKVRNIIRQRKRAVEVSSPKIYGEQVDVADINQAEEILQDPNKRIAEELLQHKVHKLNITELKTLCNEFKEHKIEVDSLLRESPLEVKSLIDSLLPVLTSQTQHLPEVKIEFETMDFEDDKETTEDIKFDI
jgi:hypothetical protein